MQPEPECDLCGGVGEMTWQQPMPGPDGALILTQMSHPCVNGCSGWWQLPAAERGGVVSLDTSAVGNVAEATQQQRADWFRPSFRQHDPLREPPR